MTEQEIRNFIQDEIIVDNYDDEEQNMSWYYYMEDNLTFPFKATIDVKKRDGSFESRQVEVVGLATTEEEFGGKEFYVEVSNADDISEVPLSRLKEIKAKDETLEALEVWRFWKEKY